MVEVQEYRLHNNLSNFIKTESFHHKFDEFIRYKKCSNKYFLDLVISDIFAFAEIHSHDCVLIFPPFDSHSRYIIHELVAEIYKPYLETFSVGLHFKRRIVVHSSLLKKRDINANVNVELNRDKAMDKKEESEKGAVSRRRTRTPRPAAPIYVPPAVRRKSQLPLPLLPNTNNDDDDDENNMSRGTQVIIPENHKNSCNIEREPVINKVDIVKNVPEQIVIEKSDVDIKFKDTCTKIEPVPELELEDLISNLNPFRKNKLINDDEHKEKDQDHQELLRAREEMNKKKRIIKQSFNTSDVLIISDDIENKSQHQPEIKREMTKKEEELLLVDNWEDLADGNGNNNSTLESDILIEIIEQVGQVKIESAKEYYDEYIVTRTLGDFDHVLELYDFPKEFQTRDLVTILEMNTNKSNTFHIKWVDDYHALAIFSSGFVSKQILSSVKHPLVKLRALSDASKKSITRAVKHPEGLLPSAVRPQTCPQTARRMVTGALGLRLGNAREERAKEIKILKEAREKRRLSAKQEEDAWLGNPKPSMD